VQHPFAPQRRPERYDKCSEVEPISLRVCKFQTHRYRRREKFLRQGGRAINFNGAAGRQEIEDAQVILRAVKEKQASPWIETKPFSVGEHRVIDAQSVRAFDPCRSRGSIRTRGIIRRLDTSAEARVRNAGKIEGRPDGNVYAAKFADPKTIFGRSSSTPFDPDNT
jgi:hypothetical protein